MSALERRGKVLANRETVSANALDHGFGWPGTRWNEGESMIGRARLTNLREAAETVLREGIAGDMIETGVWRGGACILMKGVLAAHGDLDRRVFVADSFEGLPPAGDDDDAAILHHDATLAVPQGDVESAFARYGLLDDRVEFLRGWFSDTLPTVRDSTWSVIRLDGDMYESTKDAIDNLWDGLSVGGYVIVDDYQRYASCRRAIDEHRQRHAVTTPMIRVDDDAVYWRKEA